MREWSFERWISLWHGGGLQAKQEKELQHVRDEKNLAYAFNCPFLVRILDYFQDKKQIYFLMVCTSPNSWIISFVLVVRGRWRRRRVRVFTFSSSSLWCTLLRVNQELCNAGELWSIIQGSRRTRLEPKVSKFWAAQVAMAFEYLHNVDVIFRDLKPENLLVDHRCEDNPLSALD